MNPKRLPISCAAPKVTSSGSERETARTATAAAAATLLLLLLRRAAYMASAGHLQPCRAVSTRECVGAHARMIYRGGAGQGRV